MHQVWLAHLPRLWLLQIWLPGGEFVIMGFHSISITIIIIITISLAPGTRSPSRSCSQLFPVVPTISPEVGTGQTHGAEALTPCRSHCSHFSILERGSK